MDAVGRTLSKARLPEGVTGITNLHEMIARQLDDTVDVDEAEVIIGTETDRARGSVHCPQSATACSG